MAYLLLGSVFVLQHVVFLSFSLPYFFFFCPFAMLTSIERNATLACLRLVILFLSFFLNCQWNGMAFFACTTAAACCTCFVYKHNGKTPCNWLDTKLHRFFFSSSSHTALTHSIFAGWQLFFCRSTRQTARTGNQNK